MDAAEFVVNSSSPPAEDENNERSSQEPSTEEAGNAEASANTVVDGDASATEGVAEEAAGSPQDGGSVLPSLSGWGFGSGFSWGKVMESGGRMMQTVKKQTEGVIDIYRKDITDLVQVVSSETSHVAEKLKPVMVSTTGTVVENLKSVIFEDSDEDDEEPTEFERAIEEQVGRFANSAGKVAHNVSERLSSFLNQAVKIKGADDDKKKSKKLIYDPKQAMIASLRTDPATFLEDPKETMAPSELVVDDKLDPNSPLQRAETRFQTFRSGFNIAEYAGQISRTLNEDAEMKRMMERIVPAQATYDQFWERYFFKVAEIDVQEARRKALMQGVQAADEDDFNWDEEESAEATQEEKAASVAEGDEPGEEAVAEAAEEESKPAPEPTLSEAAGAAEEDGWGETNDASELVEEPQPSPASAPAHAAEEKPSEPAAQPPEEPETDGWEEEQLAAPTPQPAEKEAEASAESSQPAADAGTPQEGDKEEGDWGWDS